VKRYVCDNRLLTINNFWLDSHFQINDRSDQAHTNSLSFMNTHSHTHTLSLSLTHKYAQIHTHTHLLTISFSFTSIHTNTHSLPLSLTHIYTLSIYLDLHTYTIFLPLSLSHTHKYKIIFGLILSLISMTHEGKGDRDCVTLRRMGPVQLKNTIV